MASEIRNRFTDTEMQIARETDLPELLSHLGYQVKRVGRFHTTAEMDSLRIKDRRTWFRYSQNTGGDAITFLQQFCGKSFPEAVEYLLTFHGKARDAPIPQPKPISPKQEFSLPPRNADDRRVFAYLRKRGIAAQVIRQFLNAGLLYEDAVHHNCVFVGRNESGQAKYAGLRGTYDLDGHGLNEARFSNIFIEKRASTCPQSLEKSRLFSYALLVSECENFQNMKRIFLRKVVI